MIRTMGWLTLQMLTLLTAQQEPKYELSYIPVHGRRMDTLVYDVDGDGRPDLINTSINFDFDPPIRWIAIHRRDGQNQLPTKPSQMIPLDDRAAALVFGDLLPGGGIEVGFIAVDGIYAYPFEKGEIRETPIKLLHLRTFFTTVSMRAIPVWSYALDLDRDGRHDLVVPTFNGYRLYFQTEAGRFGASIELEADLEQGKRAERVLASQRFASRPEHLVGHFVAGRELPRLGTADIDGDGRLDLVTLRRDVMTYFFQKQPREFSSRRRNRVSYQISTLSQEMKKDALDVAMVALLDYNNDGNADLIVTRVVGQLGLIESLETRVYLHPGTGRGNFSSDKCLLVRGVSVDPAFLDMNQDGSLDCLVSRLRTDLLSQGGQLVLFGDLPLTYEVFQFDPDQKTYLADPVFEKKVMINRDDLQKKGAAMVPLLFIAGDFTADGRPDMVFIDPTVEELQLLRGRVQRSGGKQTIGFEPGPFLRKKLDEHPKGVAVYDINGDGSSDVILHYAGSIGVLESKR